MPPALLTTSTSGVPSGTASTASLPAWAAVAGAVLQRHQERALRPGPPAPARAGSGGPGRRARSWCRCRTAPATAAQAGSEAVLAVPEGTPLVDVVNNAGGIVLVNGYG